MQRLSARLAAPLGLALVIPCAALSAPADILGCADEVASYRMGEAGAQGTAQSERIRRWLVANRFQAISQASMMSARLINTVLASQWLRR